MVWANEYMHTDDVADLLHETQAKWLEEREQMIKRHGEIYASWLATNAELNDKDAEIARLTSKIEIKDITIASFARDLSLARLLLSESNRLLEATKKMTSDCTHNGDPLFRQVSTHSWKVFRKWYWQTASQNGTVVALIDCGYCFTKKGAYKKAGMEQ